MNPSDFSFLPNDVTTPTVNIDELRFRVVDPDIEDYEKAIQYTGRLWDTKKWLNNHNANDLRVDISDTLFTNHGSMEVTEWIDWANQIVDRIEEKPVHSDKFKLNLPIVDDVTV